MMSRLFALSFLSLLPFSVLLRAEPKQLADGRIVFDAESAVRKGNSLQWDYQPTRWGRYQIILTRTGQHGEPLEIQVRGQKFAVTKDPEVGSIYVPKADPFSIVIQADAALASSIESVTLAPAPEGKEIIQLTDVIALHAHDAITHSMMMRYEPATNKNCLGYWVNPSDTAEWRFTLSKPGDYQIELWQGCGKGQGGSDVSVELHDASGNVLHTSKFVVEDTGHFQNFLPRNLGHVRLRAPGQFALWITPQRKRASAIMDIRQVILTRDEAPAERLKALSESKRVVFLGDSITYAGEYVEFVETYLRLKYPDARVEFIDLGLPSETVSGLTEPGHAGGAFPRPDLHERLARVLDKAKPDVIFACYGMNDGIYYPFSEERFAKFQEGIRFLREKSEAGGARIIHLTPPAFDSVPLKGKTLPAGLAEYRSPFEGYNGVLDRYSEWLVQQQTNGWEVIDVHTAMNGFLTQQRRAKPDFILAGDGVHVNPQGHWIIAREIFRYLDAPNGLLSADAPTALTDLSPKAPRVLKLVQQKQRVLKDAWLTDVGHLRPGMSNAKALSEAESAARQINEELNQLPR